MNKTGIAWGSAAAGIAFSLAALHTHGALYARPRQFLGTTPAEARQWQAESRAHLARILIGSIQADKPALQPMAELLLNRGTYDLYKVTYQSTSSHTNYALVSVPKKSGKHPVLLALHGHECATDIEAFTRRGHPDDFYGYFAERGFLVIAPHVLQHSLPVPEGSTLLGVWLHDALRSLDYAASRPDADMDRVGSVGLSTGGFLCLYAAALDERIKVVVPAGAFSTMHHDFTSFKCPPGCDCGMSKIEGIRELDYCDVAGLVAPRDLRIMHGIQDTAYFPETDPGLIAPGSQIAVMDRNDFDAALAESKRLYAILGAPGNIDMFWHPAGHAVDNPGAYDWLTRHLGVAPVEHADVRFNTLFNQDMVLQRDVPLPIWGTATPGEHVEVTLAGQTLQAVADTAGNWQVTAAPIPAGGPFDLLAKGDTQMLRRHIMVGDVWVCAGLAGMRTRLTQDAREFALQVSTNVRIVVAEGAVRSQPQGDLYCAWNPIPPGSVPSFSAVGLAFGDALQKRLGIPVGLIQVTAGGSVMESWIPHAAMATNPALRDATDAFDNAVRGHDAGLEAWVEEYENWRRDSEERDRAGLQILPPPAIGSVEPRNLPSRPSGLFNGTIAPFTRLPVKGVIWHGDEQGIAQSNRNQALSAALVNGWRAAWNMETLPFLLVEAGPSSAGRGDAVGGAAPGAFVVAVGELQGPGRTVKIGERLAETAAQRVYSGK